MQQCSSKPPELELHDSTLSLQSDKFYNITTSSTALLHGQSARCAHAWPDKEQ